MNKSVGIILIVASLFLGYIGIDKYNNSGASVELLGAEFSVEDSGGRETAYMYLGAGVLLLLGGVYLLGKKNNG